MTQWGLDTLFNPAKRHMDEEKRRLQSTREESGDSSGGKRIDFEAGKVTIHRATASETAEDAAEDAAAEDAAAEDAAAEDAAAEDTAAEDTAAEDAADKPEPSPAAVRAAKRRGRQPR